MRDKVKKVIKLYSIALYFFIGTVMIYSQNITPWYYQDTCFYCVDNPYDDVPEPNCCPFDYTPNDSLIQYLDDGAQKK